jgi:hypothetical protein
VRRVFEERFTSDVMARNYLRLYRRLCGAADIADVCRRRPSQPAVQANGI